MVPRSGFLPVHAEIAYGGRLQGGCSAALPSKIASFRCSNSLDSSDSFCGTQRNSGRAAFWENEAVGQKSKDSKARRRLPRPTLACCCLRAPVPADGGSEALKNEFLIP